MRCLFSKRFILGPVFLTRSYRGAYSLPDPKKVSNIGIKKTTRFSIRFVLIATLSKIFGGILKFREFILQNFYSK